MEKSSFNVEDLDENKVIKFAINYFQVMKEHIKNIVQRKDFNLDLYLKQLDGLVYAYTGCEDIIVDKSEEKQAGKKKKFLKLHNDFKNKSPKELAKDMLDTFDITSKQKKKLLSDIDDSDECRGTLIANIMTHIALMICVSINPKYFIKNNKEENNDSDINESEGGGDSSN